VINRSWLFAPGHNEKLLRKALAAGSDAVILDLEDGVPMELKRHARGLVAEFLADHPAWVRVNAARSELCVADLEAVAGSAAGIRLPKVESAADVRWVAERAPELPLICAVESAQGVIAATEIASAAGVVASCPRIQGGKDRPTDRLCLPASQRRGGSCAPGRLRPKPRFLRQIDHPPTATGPRAQGVHPR
jgi:citrate lyase beta subunit